MQRSLIIVLFLILPFYLKAQTVITGKLTDAFGNPISNASVTYKKTGAAAISGFARSTLDGAFTLRVKLPEADSVQLEFSHLGYEKKSMVVANASAAHRVTLLQAENLLEEVKVADPDIFRRNDTLHYSVEAFTTQNDRFISDIIRKLPGIEMRGDAIYYQGNPIQKYKVNNLDLMEGRYSMINKNLPADAVKSVQVVENDQPVKILDSLVFSDRATLNLELKKFTATGSGKAGLGSEPLLWDLNLTPMVLGKTFQMLTSFQTNNVGDDAARDLRMFYPGGAFFNIQEQMSNGPSYIRLREVNTPGFEQTRWLDNKMFMGSGNVLQKLESGLEVKGNVSYVDDTRQQQGFTATQSFTADEVLLTTEGIDNRNRIHVLDAGASIEKNEKDIYLRNKFQYHKRWNRDAGELLFNGQSPISQGRNYTDEALMNSLSLARVLGGQLVNITSHLEWHRTPQRLQVTPGQFEDILNQGDPFDRMAQRIDYDGLEWHNSLRFTRKVGRFRLAPALSVNYERRHLETDIERSYQGTTEVLGEPFVNRVENQQLEMGVNLGLMWENRLWKLAVNTPYSAFYYNVTQQGSKTLDGELRQTFRPSVSLTHLRNNRNEWKLQFSGGKEYGGLDNFYNAYIIQQYRSMQRYDARLLGTDEIRASLGYQYKHTMKANFANLSYNFIARERDYILTTQLDKLGRRTTGIADRSSSVIMHSISGGISSFFKTSKTIVKLNGSLDHSQSDYLLNEALARQRSYGYVAGLEIINNLSAFISGEYKMETGHTRNEVATSRSNTLFFNNHFLHLAVNPADGHSLLLKNSYYRNNISGQSAQYFMDATYRYNFKKWRTDIELSAINLFNNHQYVTQIATNFDLVQSYFDLRPRQFVLSTKFRF
jgi:hypothetical protein